MHVVLVLLTFLTASVTFTTSQEVEDIPNYIGDLYVELREAQNNATKAEEKVAELQEKVADYEAKLERLEAEVTSSRAKIATCQSEFDHCTDLLEKCESTTSILNEILDLYRNELVDLSNNNTDLSSETDDELNAIGNGVGELKDIIKKAELSIEQCKNENIDLKNQMINNTAKINQLEKTILDNSEEIENYKNKTKTYNVELNNLKNETELKSLNLSSTIKKLSGELQKCENGKEMLIEKVKNESNLDCKLKSTEMEKLNDTIKKAELSLEQCKNENKELKDKMINNTAKITQLEKTIVENSEDIKHCKNKTKICNVELNNLKNETELKSLNLSSTIKILSGELQKCEDGIKEILIEKVKNEFNCEIKSTEMEKLKETIVASRNVIENYENKFNICIDKLNENKIKLNNTLSQITDLSKTIEKCESDKIITYSNLSTEIAKCKNKALTCNEDLLLVRNNYNNCDKELQNFKSGSESGGYCYKSKYIECETDRQNIIAANRILREEKYNNTEILSKIHNNLLAFYQLALKLKEEEKYETSLTILRLCYHSEVVVHGVENADSIAIKINIGNIYSIIREYDIAIRIETQTYEICMRVFGGRNKYTIIVLYNLAHTYKSKGDNVAALGYFKTLASKGQSLLSNFIKPGTYAEVISIIYDLERTINYRNVYSSGRTFSIKF